MGCFGVPRCHETAGNKEKLGEKDKEIQKEETQNATETATILWRFLLAIFDYKTGDFLKIWAIFVPTNRGYSHIFITFQRFARMASNLQFAIFNAPKRDSQKRGSVREASGASLESGANRFARTGHLRGRGYHIKELRTQRNIFAKIPSSTRNSFQRSASHGHVGATASLQNNRNSSVHAEIITKII